MLFKFDDLLLKPQLAHRLGPSTALTPLRCGFQYKQKGHTDRNFLTFEYAMVYVLSGVGYYEDEVYGKIPVEPGCFIQRIPGVLHNSYLNGPRACLYIAIPGETYELFKLTDALASEYPVLNVGLSRSIVLTYLSMIDEMKHKKEEELMSVLINAQRCILEFHQLAGKELYPQNEQIEQAKLILSQKLHEKVKLPGLAAKLNMSYPSFRNKFIEQTGIPPGDYRIKKKIKKAQELLLEGSNVKETAAALGYPDAYSFSRQFKAVAGVSPSHYIKLSV